MADDSLKFDVLLEFLDDPAHHPHRTEIIARLVNDVVWQREWREWRALRKLARLTAVEDVVGADIQNEEWSAFLDGALPSARMNQLKELLFVSRQSREQLMLLLEALDASSDDVTLPAHLYDQALAIGRSENAKDTEYTKPSFWAMVKEWLYASPVRSVSLAGTIAVAVVLIVVMAGSQEYDFPPASKDQVAKVQSLAPTELKSIAFGEQPPLKSLSAMRMGYMAALARDMIVLGSDRNLTPQFDLLTRLDPTITKDQIVKMKGGHSPCADFSSDAELQCQAGATLYYLLRQGEPFDTDDLTQVRKAISEIGLSFDDKIVHQLNVDKPNLHSTLRRFAVDYLW